MVCRRRSDTSWVCVDTGWLCAYQTPSVYLSWDGTRARVAGYNSAAADGSRFPTHLFEPGHLLPLLVDEHLPVPCPDLSLPDLTPLLDACLATPLLPVVQCNEHAQAQEVDHQVPRDRAPRAEQIWDLVSVCMLGLGWSGVIVLTLACCVMCFVVEVCGGWVEDSPFAIRP